MLYLSNYVRFFRDHERAYIESMLSECALEFDSVMHAIVLALHPGAKSIADLITELEQAGHASEQVHARLPMLHDQGMLLGSAAEDRARFVTSWSQVAPRAVVDQVELTNVCPMHCIMCARGQAPLQRPLGYMSPRLLQNIVEQVADQQRDIKPLALHNAGESLLHKELDTCVRIVANAGLRAELSVNPGYLDLDRYLTLGAAGLARLVISLDGISAEVLETIRGKGAKANQALLHLEAILQHRRQHGQTQPELVVQMLRLRANQHQHQEFLQRFEKWQDANVTVFLKNLDAATKTELFADGDVATPGCCRAPWRSVVILWDGRVVACCYDHEGELVLGDLNQQTLDEIWHGQAVTRLRQQLLSGTVDDKMPCARCVHRPDRYQRADPHDVRFEPLHW